MDSHETIHHPADVEVLISIWNITKDGKLAKENEVAFKKDSNTQMNGRDSMKLQLSND